MKKLLLTIFTLLITGIVLADDGKPLRKIEAADLPEAAQNFIQKHFGGLYAVNSVGVWVNDYGVYMEDGQKLNFYMDGSLKEAKAEDRLLPMSILSEFPSSISDYINSKFSGWKLAEVDVEDSKIEIELVEQGQNASLVFNRSGELLEEDVEEAD